VDLGSGPGHTAHLLAGAAGEASDIEWRLRQVAFQRADG